MRLAFAASALALAFASVAAADPVTLTPITFSSEFQTELDEELGTREGDVLRRDVERAVTRALAERGASVQSGAPVSIEISVIDARPNRPTMEQTRQESGLDPFLSISTGGAELRAVLRNSGGAVIAEVEHEYYTDSLSDVLGGPSTWTDANRSIRQFANKVAGAYVANAR
jgi:hypothetical protein